MRSRIGEVELAAGASVSVADSKTISSPLPASSVQRFLMYPELQRVFATTGAAKSCLSISWRSSMESSAKQGSSVAAKRLPMGPHRQPLAWLPHLRSFHRYRVMPRRHSVNGWPARQNYCWLITQWQSSSSCSEAAAGDYFYCRL